MGKKIKTFYVRTGIKAGKIHALVPVFEGYFNDGGNIWVEKVYDISKEIHGEKHSRYINHYKKDLAFNYQLNKNVTYKECSNVDVNTHIDPIIKGVKNDRLRVFVNLTEKEKDSILKIQNDTIERNTYKPKNKRPLWEYIVGIFAIIFGLSTWYTGCKANRLTEKQIDITNKTIELEISLEDKKNELSKQIKLHKDFVDSIQSRALDTVNLED